MNPYQYYNANNGQIADLSYNQNVKNMIDILTGGNVTVNPYNQGTDEYGQDTTMYSLNGYNDASKVGENKYSIGVDDPTTRGLFDVNVEIDPLTNKVKNLGTTYNSHTAFDWSKPAMFAALAAGGLMAAPYLGGASVLGEGALAGGALEAGGTALAESGSVGGGAGAGGVESGVVGGGSVGGGSSGVGLGTGTSYSADALTNPLNPFYGTAQASPTSLGLVSGGGGATMGEGSIIGSGAGLGQTVPSSVLNVANSLNIPKPNKTQQMANALRLPTNANTNSPTYRAENPFYYSPQQQLANMLKV